MAATKVMCDVDTYLVTKGDPRENHVSEVSEMHWHDFAAKREKSLRVGRRLSIWERELLKFKQSQSSNERDLRFQVR